MKYLLVAFLSLCTLLCFSAEIIGKVIQVYDGDTIRIEDGDGGKFKVRLEGIDAPEKSQEYGLEAKDYLQSMVFGRSVRVTYKSIDMYGRIVGTVHKVLCFVDVNAEMIKAGYAWFYEDYSKDESYRKYEIEARFNHKGLWKNPNPKPPWIYRKENKK